MYVKVDNTQSVKLCDEDDLTRFSVQVPKDSSADTISNSLTHSGAGRLEGGGVAVDVNWLRLHTASRSQQWHGDFDRMLAYAFSKGWMSATGDAVIAHIDRV